MTDFNYNWTAPECPPWVEWQATDANGTIIQAENDLSQNAICQFWSTHGKYFPIQGPGQNPCPNWRESKRQRPKDFSGGVPTDRPAGGLEPTAT